jgi:hypothetical protein
LVNKASEARGNREIAELLLDNGYENVKLMPQIHASEQILRERYFGKEYMKLHPTKNPDAYVDGHFFEFKGCNHSRISERIGKAAKQANIAFIRTTEPVPDKYIEELISKQWKMKDRKNLNTIIIYNNSTLKTFTRK